jgi:signal transduction histidine kinase
LDGGSLAAALEELTASLQRKSTMAFRFVEHGEVRVSDPEVATHLYRIAQEALSNALKHSSAPHVEVGLKREGNAVKLTIEDDGVGLPSKVAEHGKSGMGLSTMRYRGRAMGANLEISSATSQGTKISCIVPIQPTS